MRFQLGRGKQQVALAFLDRTYALPMSRQLPLAQAPHSLCILRLSALGDVCNAVPAVRALQRQWPDCRITWVIGKVLRMLLVQAMESQ